MARGKSMGVEMEWRNVPVFTSPAFFNYVSDKYKSSIISNLFSNNKPYALSTHNNFMCEQNAPYFGEVLRIRVKKFKQSLSENCSKSTKIAITACNILKISWGSIPPDPPKVFLFFNLLQLTRLKKTTLEKKWWNYAFPPSLFKFLATPLNNKYHFRNIFLLFGFRIQAKL